MRNANTVAIVDSVKSFATSAQIKTLQKQCSAKLEVQLQIAIRYNTNGQYVVQSAKLEVQRQKCREQSITDQKRERETAS